MAPKCPFQSQHYRITKLVRKVRVSLPVPETEKWEVAKKLKILGVQRLHLTKKKRKFMSLRTCRISMWV